MGLSSFLTQESEAKAVVSLLQSHWQFPVDELVLSREPIEVLCPDKQCFFLHHPGHAHPKVVNGLSDIMGSLKDPLIKVVNFATLKTISKQKIIAAINRNDVRSMADRIAPEIIRLYYSIEIGLRRKKKLDVVPTFHAFFQSLLSTPSFSHDFTFEEVSKFLDDLTYILDPYILNFTHFLTDISSDTDGLDKIEFDFISVTGSRWLVTTSLSKHKVFDSLELETKNLVEVEERLGEVQSWLARLQTKLTGSDPQALKVIAGPLNQIQSKLIEAGHIFRTIEDALSSLSPYNTHSVRNKLTGQPGGLKRDVCVRLDNAELADEEDIDVGTFPPILQHVIFNPSEGFKLAIPAGYEVSPQSLSEPS